MADDEINDWVDEIPLEDEDEDEDELFADHVGSL